MIKEIEAAAAFAGWQREKEKQDKRLLRKSIELPVRTRISSGKKKQTMTLTIVSRFERPLPTIGGVLWE